MLSSRELVIFRSLQQEGGDTGDVVGDDGVPTAPMLPALEVEAQDEEEVSQAVRRVHGTSA